MNKFFLLKRTFKIVSQLIEKKGGYDVFRNPVINAKIRPAFDTIIYEPKRRAPPPPRSEIKDQDIPKSYQELNVAPNFLFPLTFSIPPSPPPLAMQPIELNESKEQQPKTSLNHAHLNKSNLMSEIEKGVLLRSTPNQSTLVEKLLAEKTMSQQLNDALEIYRKIISIKI